MLTAATVQSQKETLGKGDQQMTGFARTPGNDPLTQTRESSKVGSGEPVTRSRAKAHAAGFLLYPVQLSLSEPSRVYFSFTC